MTPGPIDIYQAHAAQPNVLDMLRGLDKSIHNLEREIHLEIPSSQVNKFFQTDFE